MTTEHQSRVRVTSLEFPTHTIPQPVTQMVPKAEEAVMTSDTDSPSRNRQLNLGTT